MKYKVGDMVIIPETKEKGKVCIIKDGMMIVCVPPVDPYDDGNREVHEDNVLPCEGR